MADQPTPATAPPPPTTITTTTTDSLTQLQDCFDQLLTRMFASIRYIDTRHPYLPIDGQSDQSPAATAPTQTQSTQPTQSTQTQPTQSTQTATHPSDPGPAPRSTSPTRDSPPRFEAILQELAQDLVVKEQQIEYLVDTLPGLGNSQASQEARIRDLETELREVEAERKEWVVVQEGLVRRVEGKIKGIRRV